MTITVCGEKRDYPAGTTAEELVAAERVDMPEYYTVIVNGEYLTAVEWGSRLIQDGDEVELIDFMGGG